MDKSYNIRDYRHGDEAGLVELLELVFTKWPHFDINCTSLEHWEWKYLDNSYQSITAPVAEDGDRIVGSIHGVPRELKLNQNTIYSSQSTDLATHPDYRRIGVYKNIGEFKTKLEEKENYGFTYAFTGNPIVFNTNMDWGRRGFPHKLSTLIRVKDVDMHLKMKQVKDPLIKKLGAKFIINTNKIKQKIRKLLWTEEGKTEYTISETKRFDSNYTTFWDKARSSYNFIFERELDYMNWRYCDPRGGEYYIFIAKEGNNILGYIILRINKANPEYYEGFIADILTLPDRNDVASSLVENANHFFDNNGINIVYTWAINGDQNIDVVKRKGYVDSRYRPYFIFENISLRDEWETLFNIPASRMHLQYGDSDWI